MSITTDIRDYVREHPGAKSNEVFDGLPHIEKLTTVHSTLARLAREGVLETRGGNPHGNSNRYNPVSWYAVDRSASERAQELAHDIYAEMLKLNKDVRQDYLAQRLDELFNLSNKGE